MIFKTGCSLDLDNSFLVLKTQIDRLYVTLLTLPIFVLFRFVIQGLDKVRLN